MSEFDDFLSSSFDEVADVLGEPISYAGKTIQAVFDEFEMSSEMERYGDTESISARCVIALNSVDNAPKQNEKLKRGKLQYLIRSVDSSNGHYTLKLKQLDKHGT